MIKFYKNIDGFDEDKPVLPYLLTIAQNELRMYWRKKKSFLSLDERMRIEEKDFENEDFNLPNININEKEKKIINLLKQGYHYFEIAKILKLNLNTIKTIIRRLRLKVKKSQDEKK